MEIFNPYETLTNPQKSQVHSLQMNIIFKKIKQILCPLHQETFYSNFCNNEKCNKRGIICGECIFDYHSNHINDCIPLSKLQSISDLPEQPYQMYIEILTKFKEKILSLLNDEIEKVEFLKNLENFKTKIQDIMSINENDVKETNNSSISILNTLVFKKIQNSSKHDLKERILCEKYIIDDEKYLQKNKIAIKESLIFINQKDRQEFHSFENQISGKIIKITSEETNDKIINENFMKVK